MKKVFTLAVLLVFSICMSVAVFAQANGKDAAFEKNKLSRHSEAAMVLDAVNNSNAKEIILTVKSSTKELTGLTADSLVYGTPYKVMIASEKDVDNSVSNNKKFTDVVRDGKYYWEVPILDKNTKAAYGSLTVEYLNGKWMVNEIGGFLPNDEIQASSDTDEIAKVLNDTGTGSADSFVHVRIPSIHKDYLVSSNKEGESFIPLKSYKDGDKKVSRNKLKPNDFRAEVKSLSTEHQNNQDTSGSITGGSAAATEKSNTTNTALYTIASLICISMAAFIVVRKLRKGNAAA